jgi:hypothetical protein
LQQQPQCQREGVRLSDRVDERASKESEHRTDNEGVSYATTGVLKATVFQQGELNANTDEIE